MGTETDVRGQVAIVTGAGQGIGRAIALRLAQDGMDVVVADLRAETAEHVASEITALGRRGLAIPMNIAIAADRERLFATTLDQMGRLDALVNNAAIQRTAYALDVTEDHWDSMMDINAKSVYFCCQYAIKHMITQQSGRVVNMASVAGKAASTLYHPIYNISKAAVIAMTKTLAYAGVTQGVRVNCVCPGVIETPMQDSLDVEFSRMQGKSPEEIRTERMGRVPMHRAGDPEEVASVVSFLVGPDSRYMTGQAINVTGGMVMY